MFIISYKCKGHPLDVNKCGWQKSEIEKINLNDAWCMTYTM